MREAHINSDCGININKEAWFSLIQQPEDQNRKDKNKVLLT